MSEPLVVCVLTANENIKAPLDYGDDFSFVFVNNDVDLFELLQYLRIDVFVSIRPFAEPAETQFASLPVFIRSIQYYFDGFGQNERVILTNFRTQKEQLYMVVNYDTEIKDIKQSSTTIVQCLHVNAFMTVISTAPCKPSNYCISQSLNDDPNVQWFFRQEFGRFMPYLRLLFCQHFSTWKLIGNQLITTSWTLFDTVHHNSVQPTIEFQDEHAMTLTQQSWIACIKTNGSSSNTIGLAKAICTNNFNAVCRFCENGYADALIKTHDNTTYSTLAFAMIFDKLHIINRLMQSITPIMFVGQRTSVENLFMATLRMPSETQIDNVDKIYKRLLHQQLSDCTKFPTCIVNLVQCFHGCLYYYSCTLSID